MTDNYFPYIGMETGASNTIPDYFPDNSYGYRLPFYYIYKQMLSSSTVDSFDADIKKFAAQTVAGTTRYDLYGAEFSEIKASDYIYSDFQRAWCDYLIEAHPGVDSSSNVTIDNSTIQGYISNEYIKVGNSSITNEMGELEEGQDEILTVINTINRLLSLFNKKGTSQSDFEVEVKENGTDPELTVESHLLKADYDEMCIVYSDLQGYSSETENVHLREAISSVLSDLRPYYTKIVPGGAYYTDTEKENAFFLFDDVDDAFDAWYNQETKVYSVPTNISEEEAYEAWKEEWGKDRFRSGLRYDLPEGNKTTEYLGISQGGQTWKVGGYTLRTAGDVPSARGTADNISTEIKARADIGDPWLDQWDVKTDALPSEIKRLIEEQYSGDLMITASEKEKLIEDQGGLDGDFYNMFNVIYSLRGRVEANPDQHEWTTTTMEQFVGFADEITKNVPSIEQRDGLLSLLVSVFTGTVESRADELNKYCDLQNIGDDNVRHGIYEDYDATTSVNDNDWNDSDPSWWRAGHRPEISQVVKHEGTGSDRYTVYTKVNGFTVKAYTDNSSSHDHLLIPYAQKALMIQQRDDLDLGFESDEANSKRMVEYTMTGIYDGDNGAISKHLMNAVVIAENTNEVVKSKLRKSMFVFEEFYKSSNEVIETVHQALLNAARRIKGQ